MTFQQSRGRSACMFACAAVLVASFAGHARAGTILSENFDTLPIGAGGWTIANNSAPLNDPISQTEWFQGNAGILSAHDGAADSYAAANFNSAGFGGNISDWLITPEIALANGNVLTFFTMSLGQADGGFPDRLQVRLSSNGGSTDVGPDDTSVGDFTNLLLDINPTLDVTSYPADWTQYSVTLSGLSGPTFGRLAFRYFVTDTSVNADYIGLDTFALSDGVVAATPVPAALPLFASGLGMLSLIGWRRKAKAPRTA